MKKLALLALAAGVSTLAPQSASAQVIVHPGGFGGGGFNHGGFGGGNFFGGFAFGGFFHQPQFHVQNWQLYGFIAPQQGQRWVRYYDDAYLVDRRGYIHDRRQRVNWDRYGERWDRDERGIPYYVGDGDYHPDGRDYRRVEHEGRYSSGWDYSGYGSACGRQRSCDDRRGGHGGGYGGGSGGGGHGSYGGGYTGDRGCGYRCGEGEEQHYVRRERSYGGHGGGYPPAPSCGGGSVCGTSYGHGGYGHSGYGYGNGGTVIVTETTVTPGHVVTEEIIEEVIEERVDSRHHTRRHAPPPRRHYAPPPRRHHAPPPPPRVIQPRGDRG